MKTRRNHNIDVLKGIAIIFVVITHYGWTAEQRQFFVFPFIINMAIPIFMIISGYVYSMSLEKIGTEHLEEAYSISWILPKVIRYTIPFLIIVMWELVDPHVSITGEGLDYLRWFLDGASGPGSYYYPVIMQLILLFPAIYFIVLKNQRWGVSSAWLSMLCMNSLFGHMGYLHKATGS